MIRLPDFTLIGTASTAAELAAQLKQAADFDQQMETAAAEHAMRNPNVRDWYRAAIGETQHELTNVNGAALLP